MNSKIIDRRKMYTRMVLKDSLMKLLQKKQLSSITVKEICELADINRSTFYAHYASQFDLLEQIEQELIQDMSSYLSSYNLEKEDDALEMTEKLFEYFATKKMECQTLLNENSNSSFEKKIGAVARQFIVKKWMEVVDLDQDISEYMSAYIVSGSTQIMKVWLNSGMNQSPKEMAELTINLIHKGIGQMK